MFSMSPFAGSVRARFSTTIAQDFAFGCFCYDEGVDGVKSIEIRALIDAKVWMGIMIWDVRNGLQSGPEDPGFKVRQNR